MHTAHLTLVTDACTAERERYARALGSAHGLAHVAVAHPDARTPQAVYSAALSASTGTQDMVLSVPVGVQVDEFIGSAGAPGSPPRASTPW